MMNYWLLKTEPSTFSFSDLVEAGVTGWDGVRNYQARNFLRDGMKRGDRALIYHSSAVPTAVVGEAEVMREGYPDPTQFDRNDEHYDPDSPRDDPRWFQVDVRALRPLEHPVTLERVKSTPKLKDMLLIRRGMRLSVQPVTRAQYEEIVKLGKSAQ